MQKTKKLILLGCVLGGVCVAAFGVSRYKTHQEEITSTKETILSIPTDTVSALSWSYEDASLAFTKNTVWKLDGDDAFPVSEARMNVLLTYFEDLQSEFRIENPDDLSQYGLDEPTCTIDLTAGDESYEIKLGAFSTMDQRRYASIGDGNVYLLAEDPFTAYETDITTMIQNDASPLFDIMDQVTAEGLVEASFTYEADISDKSYCADDMYVSGDGVALDTSAVSDYLSTVKYLSLTDYVSYTADEEDLSLYGLDDPEETITFDYEIADDADDTGYESGQFVIYIGRSKAQIKADEDVTTSSEEIEETDDETKGAYLRIGDSQIIYKITQSAYESLMAVSCNDLRHQNLFTASFEDVEKIDVTLDGKTYTFTSKTNEDEKTWYYNDEEIDLTAFQTAAEALSANEFTEEEPSDVEEISIIFYLNNENFKKATITLYRYDGESCVGEVDGGNTCLITRSQAVALVETVHTIVLGSTE